MRAARAHDWARRLANASNWPVRLCAFNFDEVPSLGTAMITLDKPLNLISGPNGVGKTTLLRCIWATLDPERARPDISWDKKLTSGRTCAHLKIQDVDHKVEAEFGVDDINGAGNLDVSVTHIDASSEPLQYQREFNLFDGPDEITNGSAPRVLGDAEVAEVNSILKRNYRSITLYETDLGRTAPFFEVAYGNDTYDSRSMGAGELSALHIWWHFSRSETGAILLVEEPESFLSYGCQIALAQYIVSTIVRKRIVVVMTTHSAPFLHSAPVDSIRFLTRGSGGLDVLQNDPPQNLLSSLGMLPRTTSVIFVEDEAARDFTRCILEHLAPAYSRSVEISVMSGDGGITRALRVTREIDIPVRFVGVFDGDLRGKIPRDIADISSFLPLDTSIEESFRELISSNPGHLTNASGFENVRALLNSIEGMDCHDWFRSVSMEVGLTTGQLLPALFREWISVEVNLGAARELVGRLSELTTR